MRTITSAGNAQLRSVAAGPDGLQSPEFAPTFSNAPNLQDGPDAAGASGTAATATSASASLKQARKRFVNRSIARQRGLGEWIAGDDRQSAGPQLVASFDGLTLRDQRLANGGNQFTVEPPDQGLCVGNGFIVESVNDVIRVYDRHGQALTGTVDLNTFYGYAPAINRATGTFGPSLTDPSCYYDPQVNRFFQVILTIEVNPATGDATGANHLDLAVSSSGDPRGSWTIYRIPVQDDGTQGTPVHAQCPCLGDYPHIGADAHGLYLTTNEFPFSGGFNGAQIYALSKQDLVRGAASVTLVQIDTNDHLLEGNPGFTVWPAVSPSGDFATANRGTEYFLSSLAVFTESGNENRLRVWALGNTRSLETNTPDVTLVDNTVTVRSYGVPPLSNQKAGATPLADCINDTTLVTPFGVGCWNYLFTSKPPAAAAPELLDSNDSRMQQVYYAGGRLYGALDTVVNVRGGQQAGIAYYAIRPFAHPGSVIGIVETQGKIGVAGNNANYPAIAVRPDGVGAIAFTLVGADHYPSAAYVRMGPNGHGGPVQIAAEGKGPADGFTGYEAYNPGTANARWGDYGAAVVDGGDVWIASEYIGQTCSLSAYVSTPFGSCGGTRVTLGNWGTRISRIKP
ncbi:MAG TPA: hypothetical protein VJO99_00360 [Burkholderiaceae bacterium]|nr:hypothetical protein [Burkholderiaceae bacterium]